MSDHHRTMIDSALRQVVEARLRAPSGSHASRSRADLAGFIAGVAGVAADLLHGYRLERELHRGGQGVVYRGVQLSTGRTVAVKLLPRGMFASRAEQLRFEREVHVLGQLEAPGIVRIVDSGVAAGHWWFTMDYIDGVPLDEYVRVRLIEPSDGSELSPGSRAQLLSIFADVAEAVNAAHLHGVIHRDLKPRNILVDESGHAHVLDFGLAKLDSKHAGDVSQGTMTETGQFVGSLPWASPEQAAGRGAIDLRSDVYSLGVILYQVLTGQFPYRIVGGAAEVVSNIVTVEPAAPSTLIPSIDDELGTIVMKCLNKEAQRRYQSAGDLARDIRRYLAGEPIEAKRESLAYLLRKRLRQHRIAAVIATLVVLLIAAASMTPILLWRTAARERDWAIASEQKESVLRRTAEAQTEKAARTNEFLQSVISAADPYVAQGRELTVRQMMEDAVHQLDAGQLTRQPELEAAVRFTVAQAFLGLGRFDQAAGQSELALDLRRGLPGPAQADLAETLVQLSTIRSHQGRRREGIELASEALAIARSVHEQRDHPDVVYCLKRLGWAHAALSLVEEGAAYLAEAVAMLERLYGTDDLRTMQVRVDQTIMSHDIAGSEQLLRDAIEKFRGELGPYHPDVQSALSMLGGLLQMKGDFDGAEQCYREALAIKEAVFGRRHPLYIEGVQLMAKVTARRGNVAGAIGLLSESLDDARLAYGEESFGLAQFYNVLGTYQLQAGATADCEQSFATSLKIFQDIGRDRGIEATKARVVLSRYLIERDELEPAEQLIQQCLAADEEQVPPDHWLRAMASSLLGRIRTRQNSFDEAEQLLLTGYRGLETQSAASPAMKRDAILGLVAMYEAWESASPGAGKAAQAQEWRARLAEHPAGGS